MKKSLRYSLLSILLFAGFNQAEAQMSGTVSINSSASATANNFKNWYSFWRSLQGLSRNDGGPATGAGISASLKVNVYSDLTESEAIQFPTITGLTSSATISILGHSHYVAFSGPHEVISFSGADYVTIDSLTIRNTGSNGARNSCVRLYNNSNNNTIQNCILEFTNLSTGASNGSAYLAFAANDTVFNAATSVLTGSNNTIKNNTCRTQAGSPGPAYGISICGSTSGYSSNSHNNTVSGNHIENFYRTAIYLDYGNGNQLLNNDISRNNSSSTNCDKHIYAFEIKHQYGTGRSTRIGGNYIHDLPFAGAPSSSGAGEFHGIHSTNNYGSSSRPYIADSNSFVRIAVLGNAQIGYFSKNEYVQVQHNTINKLETYNNITSMAVWEFRSGDELDFSRNQFINSYIASESSNYFFTDSVTASKTGMVSIYNNTIENNKFFMDAYMILPNTGNFDIRNNTISNNFITGGKSGYLYAIGSQQCENINVFNNLIANNLGHNGFVGIYLQSFLTGNYTARAWQNTVYSDGDKAPVGKGYDNNGIYLETYYHSGVEMGGNITEILNSYSGTITGINVSDTADIDYWDNNSYYVVNVGDEYWTSPIGTAYTYTNFQAYGLTGKGENFVNPLFENPAQNKFRSYKWETQNNVPTQNFNTKDITGNARNNGFCDRGVYEQFTDLQALRTGLSIGSSVCSGFQFPADITVKNNFKDTARNFYVALSNGSQTLRQKVTKALLPGDSTKVTFTGNSQIDKWGKQRIAVFIDAYDDNYKNDSFAFITTVKPAPGGGKIVPGSQQTQTRYGNGVSNDITVVGEKVYYAMTAPRSYNNSAYNSNWSASAWAVTTPGKTAVGTVILTGPSGGTDMQLSFQTINRNLEDSTVRFCVKITDLVNGCDTTACRNIFIAPVPDVDFSGPSLVCGNDTAHFKSASTIKKGGMVYHWDFGTGNAADTSDQPEPYFIYSKTGNYKVKLTVTGVPYGFSATDSMVVSVNPKPNVNYTRTNACEGESIQFTNTSTPSGLTYLWTFGDGATSSTASPIHAYSKPGQYLVKLMGSTGGCKDSSIQKAYTFSKPVVDFSFQANQCSNSPVAFTNLTTCNDGTFASYWDLVTAKSNLKNPVHTFGNAGSPKVKLVAVSSFGCKDSITKTISLKEAPVVSFTHTEACTLDSTVFTNTSPKVPSTSANYKWTFGDGGFSYAENPWHRWSNTGPMAVKFVIELSNGCKDSAGDIMIVHTQPKVKFTDNSPVCFGSQVNFNNQTTWASGNIHYQWKFGDSNSSLKSDPSHLYNTNETKLYNVELCADIDSFCRTCYTKAVTLNEIPATCDFAAEPDYVFGYYGMRCIPKNATTGNTGLQTGVTYKWNFQNNGFKTEDTGRFNFQTDGTYQVTMCAEFGSTGCSCCSTKQVVVDRSGLTEPGKAAFVVYPNPNNGDFKLVMPENAEWRLEIISVSGQLVYQNNFSGSNSEIKTPNLKQGIYSIRMTGNENVLSQLLIIENYASDK